VIAELRARPGLVACTLTYAVAFLAYGVANGEAVAPVSFVVVVLLGLLLLRVRHTVRLPEWTLWVMALWGLGHMAGTIVELDDGRVLYNVVLLPFDLLRYDQLVHAVGFGTATVICGFAFRHWFPEDRVTLGQALFVALAGLGIGAINEIVEFASTRISSETHVGGYVNTSWDLVADLTGALAAAAWFLWKQPEPVR
jgi:hypothetical protein